MKQEILSHLPGDFPWRDRIHWFDVIDSTNTQLKALAIQGAPHGTVLVAGHQTQGHGRRGRSFHSPEGMGVYLSVLLRPQCPADRLMHLTCAAAVAMCEAAEAATGIRPGIKWTNDLVWKTRKLGGILTEVGFTSQGLLDYAIVGVGLNCCQQEWDFPPDIRDMATSFRMVCGSAPDRSQLAAAMIAALFKMDEALLPEKENVLRCYRRDCVTLGQEILLVRGDIRRRGKALDIDGNGALIVEFAPGCQETVNSGEVSVRGMYGYL